MVFVTILHVLLQGGILLSASVNSIQYDVAWFIEISTFCAVDIFALISGFVAYSEERKPFSLVSLIMLWMRVVFISAVVCLVFLVFAPELVTYREIVTSLMPFTFNSYWYFNAYVGLYLFKPFINTIIKNAQKDVLMMTTVTIFIVFSLLPLFVKTLTGYHPFGLSGGASLIWIIILYYLGAVIKKYEIYNSFSIKKSLIVICVCVFVTFGWFVSGESIQIFDSKLKLSLIDYTSPTILLISVMYLFVFARINIPVKSQKAIGILASGAFSAYIVNLQPLFWKYCNAGRFSFLASQSPFIVFISVVLIATLFVLLISMLDILREKLFAVLKLKKLAIWMNKQSKNIINRCVSILHML